MLQPNLASLHSDSTPPPKVVRTEQEPVQLNTVAWSPPQSQDVVEERQEDLDQWEAERRKQAADAKEAKERKEEEELAQLEAELSASAEELVQMLTDLGFPEPACRKAVIKTGTFEAATDWLLIHREDPDFATPIGSPTLASPEHRHEGAQELNEWEAERRKQAADAKVAKERKEEDELAQLEAEMKQKAEDAKALAEVEVEREKLAAEAAEKEAALQKQKAETEEKEAKLAEMAAQMAAEREKLAAVVAEERDKVLIEMAAEREKVLAEMAAEREKLMQHPKTPPATKSASRPESEPLSPQAALAKAEADMLKQSADAEVKRVASERAALAKANNFTNRNASGYCHIGYFNISKGLIF